MTNIQFVTDEGSDLHLYPERLQNRDIQVLPIYLSRASDNYEPNLSERSGTWVYNQMRAGEMFRTSQVNPQEIANLFVEYVSQGIPVIYTALSGGLSNTAQNARFAAEMVKEKYPEAQLEVIDSRAVSVSYGDAILDAYDMANLGGASFDETVETLMRRSRMMEHVFTVDTMEYLYRGGRVSRLGCAVASTLNIRPLLDMDAQGRLQVFEKVRGMRKTIDRLTDVVLSRSGGVSPKVVGVHTDAEDFMNEFLEALRQKDPGCSTESRLIGPALGAHVGPGMAGIIFMNPDRDYDDTPYRSRSAQRA